MKTTEMLKIVRDKGSKSGSYYLTAEPGYEELAKIGIALEDFRLNVLDTDHTAGKFPWKLKVERKIQEIFDILESANGGEKNED